LSIDPETKKMFQTLCRVLEALVEYSRLEWKYEMERSTKRLNEDTRNRYKELSKVRYPIQLEELKEQIDEATDLSFATIRPLYLPPLNSQSDFIPLLNLKCWFANDPPKIKLRVGFFGGFDNRGISKPGIGFRFETRHKGDQHDFDHMQLCIGPFDDDKFNKEYLKCPTWLPSNWPAVTTPSKDPVSLLVSMLVSFYGRDILQQFRKINLEKYTKALNYVLE